MPSQNIVYILVELNENNLRFTMDKDSIFSAAWSRKYRIDLKNRNTTIFTANNYLLGYEPNCADEDHIFALYFKDDNKIKKILLAKGADSKGEEVFVITDKVYYFFNNEWQEEDFFRGKNFFPYKEILNKLDFLHYINLTEYPYLFDSDFAYYSKKKLATNLIHDVKCPRKFFYKSSVLPSDDYSEILQLFMPKEENSDKIFMVDIYTEFTLDLQCFADYFRDLDIIDDTEKVQLFCLAIESILCGNSQFNSIDIKVIIDKLPELQKEKLYIYIQEFRERLYPSSIYGNFKDIDNFKDLELNMVFGYYVQILFYVLLKNKNFSLAQIKQLKDKIINIPLHAYIQIQYYQAFVKNISSVDIYNSISVQEFIVDIGILIYQQIKKFNERFKFNYSDYEIVDHDFSNLSIDTLFSIFEIYYYSGELANTNEILTNEEKSYIQLKKDIAQKVTNNLSHMYKEEDKFFGLRYLTETEIKYLILLLKNKKEDFISFALNNFSVSAGIPEKEFGKYIDSIIEILYEYIQQFNSQNENIINYFLFDYRPLIIFLDKIVNEYDEFNFSFNLEYIENVKFKLTEYSHKMYLCKLYTDIHHHLDEKENKIIIYLLKEFDKNANLSYQIFYKLFGLRIKPFAFAKKMLPLSQYENRKEKFKLFDIACQESLLNLIEIMLEDFDIRFFLNKKTTPQGYSLLYRTVVIQNNELVIRKLLQTSYRLFDINENFLHPFGSGTILNWAIKTRNYEIAILLLNAKALFSYEDCTNGKTDFVIAVEENFYDLVQAVLQMKHAITLDLSQMNMALAVAVKKGYVSMTKLFIEFGVDVNCRINKAKDTILMSGIKHEWFTNEHMEVFKIIINNKNFRSEILDENNACVLLLAARKGLLHIVSILVHTSKFNINNADNKGDTPLIAAAENGHVKTVQFLLKHPQIKINLVNAAGDTALMAAVRHDEKFASQDIFKILAYYPNIDLNIKNRKKESLISILIDKIIHCYCRNARDILGILLSNWIFTIDDLPKKIEELNRVFVDSDINYIIELRRIILNTNKSNKDNFTEFLKTNREIFKENDLYEKAKKFAFKRRNFSSYTILYKEQRNITKKDTENLETYKTQGKVITYFPGL